MGMDVYGRKPINPAGEYFRNNVWWWRPLADYACSVAPAITASCKYWGSNDGDGLTAAKSRKLAEVLRAEVASGRTREYSEQYAARIAAIPRETCEYCDGTGVRRDAVGQGNGQTVRKIDTPNHPRDGQIGWCNGCDGRGDKESFAAYYPFSVENVEEFCTFLEGCGGFKIC